MSESRIGSDDGRGEGPATLSVGESEEIDRLCDRFEAAWRSGDRPRFEDHLPSGDGPFRTALKAELIAIELEWRRRHEGVQPRPDRAGDTAEFRRPGRGVLETLSASVGAVPHVLLRDTDGGPEPPVHRPGGGEPGQGTRYRIDGEIARGGMGAVLKGRDPDIGRDVALKVLREDFRDDADMVRRFVEEAQIGGQLQHPGIVPIYEMGTLGDRRPFFSMKLVKGDTLARLLAARKDPHDGLPRLLTIFEAVAQTVAYAHARGVIHRDLKPSNVMVGAFGEVQVMDWGLAKVLARGGAADDAEAGKIHRDETVIATARSGSTDSDLSRAGSVLGTPSYMAPEQARGEIEHIDERADVFALGSILCEILTAEAAFVGRNSGEIQRTAALGDTAGALARLEACGADAELISLAKDCLAREAQDRPATAGGVSNRVTAYLAGVQDRLRRAELERVEERARRRLTTVVAASLILLGLLGGGGYVWNQLQSADRRTRTALAVDEALADASRLRGEALSAPPSDAGRWSAALAAAKRAEGLLTHGEADAELKNRVDTLMTAVERDRATAAEKARQIDIDKALVEDLESVRGNLIMDRDLKRADTNYGDAFRKAGLDIDVTGAQEAGRWVASRTEPVELAGYLDYWAFVRRQSGRPEADWQHLVAVARGGDSDPWRDALRSKLGSDDGEAVAAARRMADDPKLEDQPAAGILLLARQLRFGCNDGTRATEILRRAARRYPGDFRVHVELALASSATVESGMGTGDVHEHPEEAVRHLTSALGIRPASVATRIVLNFALLASGRFQEAEAVCRDAVRIKPDDSVVRGALANSLRWQRKDDEAARVVHEAIRLNPNDGGCHHQLGIILRDQMKFDESIIEFREAIRLKPYTFGFYLDYAEALRRKADYKGALALVRKAQSISSRSVFDLYHSPEWLAKIESLAALAERLPALLKGVDRPKNNAERVDVGQICAEKNLHAAALRFRSEALDEDPKLDERRRLHFRYNTACSALLLADGRSDDATPLDQAAKSDLRRRALAWLKAELAAWSKIFEAGSSEDRTRVISILRWWTRDTDLATIRGALALAKVPEAERQEWQAFWVEYEALMRKGNEPQTR